MKVEFNNYYRIMRVHIEETDMCTTCTRTNRCPLILMLKDNLAALKRQSVRIDECWMHKKKGV